MAEFNTDMWVKTDEYAQISETALRVSENLRKEYSCLKAEGGELYLEFVGEKDRKRGCIKLNRSGSYPTNKPFKAKGKGSFKLEKAEFCGEVYYKVGKKA